jgi:RNA polymerase sigma-70 factor (ECF subfamily)
MEQSDEDIMLDYQAGNQAAVEELFKRYKTRIFNFCLSLLSNRADAEESAAEVFLALVSQHNAFDARVKFSTWLYTIARNKSVDRLRKRKNLVSMWFSSSENGEASQFDIADVTITTDEKILKKEAIAYMRLAIRKLPLEQKEALVLKQYHGLSYDDISGVMDCSVEKVKILIFRAKQQLRVALGPLVKGGE